MVEMIMLVVVVLAIALLTRVAIGEFREFNVRLANLQKQIISIKSDVGMHEQWNKQLQDKIDKHIHETHDETVFLTDGEKLVYDE